MCTSYLYVIALQFDFTLRMTIFELFSDDRHAIAFPGLRLFSVNGVGGYHIRVQHFLNAPLTRARSGSLGALHAVQFTMDYFSKFLRSSTQQTPKQAQDHAGDFHRSWLTVKVH